MAWAEKGYRRNVAKRDGYAPLTRSPRQAAPDSRRKEKLPVPFLLNMFLYN